MLIALTDCDAPVVYKTTFGVEVRLHISLADVALTLSTTTECDPRREARGACATARVAHLTMSGARGKKTGDALRVAGGFTPSRTLARLYLVSLRVDRRSSGRSRIAHIASVIARVVGKLVIPVWPDFVVGMDFGSPRRVRHRRPMVLVETRRIFQSFLRHIENEALLAG